MTMPQNIVSIHPYFKIHPGKLEQVLASLPAFVERTSREENKVFYEFTLNGDELFCREAYVGAAGALAHLTNVGDLLRELLTIADLTRLEIHGPAAELDQMREPLADLHPAWFISQ